LPGPKQPSGRQGSRPDGFGGRGILRRALTPHLNGLVSSRSECHNGTATWLPSKK